MSDPDDLDGLWDAVPEDHTKAPKPAPKTLVGPASVASVPPPAMPDLDDAWGSPPAPAVAPKAPVENTLHSQSRRGARPGRRGSEPRSEPEAQRFGSKFRAEPEARRFGAEFRTEPEARRVGQANG